MNIRYIVLVGAGLALWPSAEAQAEFWTALSTEPKPNVVIGIDASVTMGIEPNACGGNHVCHKRDRFHPRTRLSVAKRNLLDTIPSFKDYFAFGGFRYQGCYAAHVSARVLPDNKDLAGSYGATETMIRNSGHCRTKERRYPGFGAGSPTAGCLTPSENCRDDPAAINQIVTNGVDGITVTPPSVYGNIPCNQPGAPRPFINLQSILSARLVGGSFTWPAWGTEPDVISVQNELCNPLQTELEAVRRELEACTTAPNSVWDMTFLNTNWCDASRIANNICDDPPFDDSCVCRPNQPDCQSGSAPPSACGNVLTWKARQQVAVCETYNPRTFGDLFLNHPSQEDNIARGSDPKYCRENVALFMTDGAFGYTPGVIAEAAQAQDYYRSADRLSNMFVFHISNTFRGSANAMMREVSGHRETEAFRAQDRAKMAEAFSKVLSRIYRGVYNGAPVVLDSLERRAVMHSFTVPGHDVGNRTGVSDDYLGIPSKLSVHAVDEDGVIDPDPLYESDESSRIGRSTNGCGPIREPASMYSDFAYPGIRHVDLLGPAGTFRNGVDRIVSIAPNLADRSGDNRPDSHPRITYGYSFGMAQSAPLIVDAPRDVPTGGGNVSDAVDHLDDTRERPRIIYYQANGYIIGLHGGEYRNNTGRFGDVGYAFEYDDGVPYAGTEVFRFRPEWLTESGTRYDYRFNDVVQQPLTTGQQIARELYVDGRYRTMLIFNQGRFGRGYAAVDITDPCTRPPLVSQWTLPRGNFASGEPNAYQFPMDAAPVNRAVLVATSGLEADTNAMYVFDLATGNEIARRTLPGRAGYSYPTAPVCVDATGEGTITHCYALRSDGFLARVEVEPGGLKPAVDVTPVDASNDPVTIGGGRTFYTQPVAFFDVDGSVSLVFGSGDYQNLTEASGANYVYKVRDTNTRKVGVPPERATTDRVCMADGAGNTDGVFALDGGERLISKPIVEDGIVSWTTYVSRTNGCTSGRGYVYTMKFESCYDAMSTDQRPKAQPIGPGLPAAPTLHQQSKKLLVNTSAGPTAAQVAATAPAETRGNGLPFVKRLYWRLELDSQ